MNLWDFEKYCSCQSVYLSGYRHPNLLVIVLRPFSEDHNPHFGGIGFVFDREYRQNFSFCRSYIPISWILDHRYNH